MILASQVVQARFTDQDLQYLVTQSVTSDSDALIVWQDGKITHNFNKNVDQLYSIQSISKSLTAITAACLTKNEPNAFDAAPVFKSWEGSTKATISLRMLLQMSSGIQDPVDFWTKNEYYDYSLELPLVTTPGYNFTYANSSTMLLGKWMKEKTGKPFSALLEKCFLNDLGIKEYTISKDKSDNEVTSGGLYMKADDLMKFGIMLIQNGSYNGKQLLTPAQVAELRNDDLSDGNGYGQGFWTWGRKIYYGEGFLGQWLMLVPKSNLVVLRLRNPPNMQWSIDNDLKWMHNMPWLLQSLL